MDAPYDAREQRKLKLLAEVAEIEVEQQRERGWGTPVPHFGALEDAGQQLGRMLSTLTQSRLANEVASNLVGETTCADCGRTCAVEPQSRTVTGLDGPVTLVEPQAHCPACRRDFFPSA